MFKISISFEGGHCFKAIFNLPLRSCQGSPVCFGELQPRGFPCDLFIAGDFCDFCERNDHYGLVVARLLDSVKLMGLKISGWKFLDDLDLFGCFQK